MSDNNLHLARLKKGDNTFEVVIDPDLAMDFREGKDVQILDVMKNDKVWFDAKKGQEASHERLESLFETDDILKVAEIIIKEGDIQLTAEYRAKKRDELRKKILTMIQVFGIDPKTKLPHPMTRIEAAFDEGKIRIDENQTVERQIQDIVKKLRPILPIKIAVKEIQVKIPAESAGKAFGTVSKFGKILSENWMNDGSWLGIVEIPGGMETDFYDTINKVCKCEVEAKVLAEK